MGAHLSKKPSGTSDLASYEAACMMDSELQQFDSTLQVRISQVISSLAVGAEVPSLSFDSLREVTECLLKMNQDVVKFIFKCKQDIWKNQELFELVEEYFENSLQMLDFCDALENCLRRARDSQLLIMVVLQRFEDECGLGENNYSRTLEELKAFKAAGSPFTDEFHQIFQLVYKLQISMLEKLQHRETKLDKKLKYMHAWHKVSYIIFVATFASVLICSIVAAAIAAPPVASALAVAASIPLGSMGKWIDSLWKNFENVLKGQKEIIGSMQVSTSVAIKDLDKIRVLIDRLEIDIESLMTSAEIAFEDDAVKLAITEIKNKLNSFTKNVDDLRIQADMCSRAIRRARTVILRRIINPPNF